MSCLDFFSMKAGWGLREETVEACVSRCGRWLNDLWDIHPDFRTLRWSGAGQQVATRSLLGLCRSGDLRKVFSRHRVHNISRTRILSDGCGLTSRSGAGSSQSLMLCVHAGAGAADADRAWFPNYIELTIIGCGDPEGLAAMLLGLRPVLLSTADAWDVDWGKISSAARIAQTAGSPYGEFGWRFAGAWAVYLADRFASRVTAPAQAFIERRPNGALLMAAAEDVFNGDDPSHVEAADAMDASLAPLNPWPDG